VAFGGVLTALLMVLVGAYLLGDLQALRDLKPPTIPFEGNQYINIYYVLVGAALLCLAFLMMLRTSRCSSDTYNSHSGEIHNHYYAPSSEELGRLRAELSHTLETQGQQLRSLSQEVSHLRSDNVELLTIANESDDLASTKFRRPLQVSLYTSIDESAETEALQEAVKQLMATIGFDLVYEAPALAGSWIKDLWFRTKDELSKPELQDRVGKVAGKAERALEIKYVDAPQANVDVESSKAVLHLVKALDKVPNGIVCIGSLFILKTTTSGGESRLAVLQLSQEEMELVKSHPAMKTDPAFFNAMLRAARAPDSDPSHIKSLEMGADQPMPMQSPSKRRKREPEVS
jgi:hypothetical protein